MGFDHILVERSGAFATVTMNRPQRRNALSREHMLELIAAFGEIKATVPFVVRLDGTNDAAGRRLLAEANLPNVHSAATMNEAAEKVVALAAGGGGS